MKLRLALLPLLLCGMVPAQQSLVVAPAGGQYIWVPPPATAGFFFDMVLTTTVTFQGVSFPTYTPVGTSMSMQMWVTNPGTTTHVGNEANPALWSMIGSGSTVVPPAPATAAVCFTSGAVLQPGTYGIAMIAQGANNIFANNGLPQVFSNADMTLTLGSTSYGGFTSPLANYLWIGTLFYAPGVAAHTCASRQTYGKGCNVVSGSFYQKWTNNAAAAASLNNRRLTLQFAGANYNVLQSTVPYIAPSPAATTLVTTNNGEVTVNLSSPFVFPGGATTQLVIATDGHIAPISNQPLPGANYSFMPYVPGFLDAPNAIWAACWHNFNTTELNSGQIKTEQVGNLFIVTWDNVESLPGNNVTQNPNPCTFQVQFDLTTFDVHYVYQTITTIGGSQSYDDTIVGWSPGGPSPDAGPIDVATLTALALPPFEVLPLRLVAPASPVLGTNVDFVTSNENTPGIGLNFLSLAGIPAPGIDLGILGAPSCAELLDPIAGIGNVISNLGAPLPPMNVSLPIPLTPALSGTTLYSQSIWLDPAANPFGATTSNAVSMVLGLFAL